MSAANKSSRRYGVLIVGVLVGSVLLARGLMATAPKAERRAPERQARLVEVTPVRTGEQRIQFSAHGTVAAAQRVALTAQVSGVVAQLSPAFVPGATVRQGQWLLRIDDRDARLAVARAEADLASAQATLAQEQGNQVVARADLALLGGELSADERALMLREPQLQSARAQVAVARAALAAAKLDLERTEIRAPFDAQVISRQVAVGAQVGGAGTPLGELAASEDYWVTLMAPADALRWLQLPDADGQCGSTVAIRDTSQPGSAPWSGRLIRVLDEVEANGRRAQLLVEVSPRNADGQRLLLGSYVQGQIQGTQVADVLRLSPAWLQQGQAWQVLEGRLQPLPLKILHADASAVLARTDTAGEVQVVTRPVSGAVAGMQVRTTSDSTPAGAAAAALGAGVRP